jgi:hypothetical protein
MNVKKRDLLKELQVIAKNNNGNITPQDVVDYAIENKQSALHQKFTWDDNQAAIEYRLWQARQLIASMEVTIVYNNKPYTIRAYTSLKQDRNPNTGYRSTEFILRKADLQEMLLIEAYDDAQTYIKKYRNLKAVAPVIAEMKKLRKPKK